MRYGETYTQAIELSGKALQTLTNYKRLGKIFPPHRRLWPYAMRYYEAVSALSPDEQDNLLNQVEIQRWDSEALREEARKLRAKPRELPTVRDVISDIVEDIEGGEQEDEEDEYETEPRIATINITIERAKYTRICDVLTDAWQEVRGTRAAELITEALELLAIDTC